MCLIEKVCVEPPPSALNMTLPAFAAERRRVQHCAGIYRSTTTAEAGAQQQTRRPPLLLSIDGTDRCPTVTHTIQAASINDSSSICFILSDVPTSAYMKKNNKMKFCEKHLFCFTFIFIF